MTRRILLAVLLLVPAAVPAADKSGPAEKKDDPSKASTDPPNVPLQLIVKAHETYELNTGGDQPRQYQEKLQASVKNGKFLSATPMDPALEMEIKNTSKSSIQIWESGDGTEFDVTLTGNFAMSVKAKSKFEGPAVPNKVVTIPAGKSHKLTLSSLSYGYRGEEKRAYIADTGGYELRISFKTAVSPAPANAKPQANGFGEVKLKSAPVTFRVTRPT